MQAHGRGMAQDWSASARVFQHAADSLGHAGSAYYLGLQYAHGQGLPVDYSLAQLYLSRAAAGLDPVVGEPAALALAALERASQLAEGVAQAALDGLSYATAISVDGGAFED